MSSSKVDEFLRLRDAVRDLVCDVARDFADSLEDERLRALVRPQIVSTRVELDSFGLRSATTGLSISVS